MARTRDRIQAMDDFQVVRFFEAFVQQLLAGSSTTFDAIKSGVPPSVRSGADWARLEGLTEDQANQLLEPSEAAAASRRLLLQLADDPSLGPALDAFLASFRDDELVADVVLAVGLVASVLLIAATTEFEGQIAGVKFKKGKADPETIKALVSPFASLLSGSAKS